MLLPLQYGDFMSCFFHSGSHCRIEYKHLLVEINPCSNTITHSVQMLLKTIQFWILIMGIRFLKSGDTGGTPLSPSADCAMWRLLVQPEFSVRSNSYWHGSLSPVCLLEKRKNTMCVCHVVCCWYWNSDSQRVWDSPARQRGLALVSPHISSWGPSTVLGMMSQK